VEKFAKIISTLFHPLLMPTFGVLLMLNTDTYLSFFPIEAKLIIYLIVFAGTFLLPLLLLPFFLYRKYIKKITMDTRKERIAPLIITIASYYFTYYVIKQLPLPLIFNKFLLATTISVALTLIITLYWKISAHMIGIGGMIGLIVGLALKFSVDFRFILMILLLIAGLIGTSRLYLKSHNSLQVYSGFFIGILIIGGFMIFL